MDSVSPDTLSYLKDFALFQNLPKELQSLILLNCPYKTLYQYSKTSKKVRKDLQSDGLLWENKTRKDYEHIWDITPRKERWVETYHYYRNECWGRLCVISYYDGDPEMFRKLLEMDIDLNRIDEDGDCPLMWAYLGVNLDFMQQLLQAGADPNTRVKSGETFLVYICSGDNPKALQIIEILLNAGADPDLPGKNGRTPLMEACLSRNILLVDVLLEFGADPLKPDKNYETALDVLYKPNYPSDICIEMLKIFAEYV